MSKTWASGVGGGVAVEEYSRINDYKMFWNGGLVMSSVANRAFAVYTEVRRDCTVASLGVHIRNRVNGNLMLGLYDSSFNQLCLTDATAVAGLTDTSWNWIIPSTLPTIDAGLYWLAVVCDANWVAATTGTQFAYRSSVDDVDSADLGNQCLVQMDAAYPLPDPLVPVNSSNIIFLNLNMRVT